LLLDIYKNLEQS